MPPRKESTTKSDKKPIVQYDHPNKKRKNNPPVGLVTPETDKETGKKTYAYDPHLDPQLVWAGKKEHTSFEVPTVSLHVHERIDPRTIMEAVRKKNGNGIPVGAQHVVPLQTSLFESPTENLPLRDAIDFYKHDHNWPNRMIAGDSLLVMNSLLEKEGMAGQVQMIYIDPPYGIKYGSNFQPFVNKRDVKDGSDEDLTAEPEMIRAFRDTWELGIHSYLTYLRDRLLLARELLTESGSCFVQISDENVHLVRNLMDEVFGTKNFVSLIAYSTTSGLTSGTLSRAGDYLFWYCKEISKIKYRQLFVAKEGPLDDPETRYGQVELNEGVGSGFRCKTVPHVTLKSIANNEPPGQETLYDQPFIDHSKARVTGPFTVEAVPAPMVKSISDVGADLRVGPNAGEHTGSPLQVDQSVARTGPTVRHAEWRDELLRTGVRGKNGRMILFSRVEPLSGTRWLHAEAETKPNDQGADSVAEPPAKYGKPVRVVISFGPEHAPLEQRQVEMAWEEARQLSPKPAMILFAAFQFDPEAAKDIDELTPEKTGMTFLKVQMNTDLLTEDLKKKPKIRAGTGACPYFDYYNTKTGAVESGDTHKIAVWMLDPDYDGRSLYPRQVFFPMSGKKDGWSRLAKNLKAEIDEELIEVYRGTISLPFEAGEHKRTAVKIVDDRGIESLRIVELRE